MDGRDVGAKVEGTTRLGFGTTRGFVGCLSYCWKMRRREPLVGVVERPRKIGVSVMEVKAERDELSRGEGGNMEMREKRGNYFFPFDPLIRRVANPF